MNNQNFHETYTSNSSVKIGSSRKFGLMFCAFFLILALAPLLKNNPIRTWALTLSVIFGMLAQFIPSSLDQINKAWMNLGEILRKVTTPIILFILFFFVLTPIALILKIMKKDLLNMHFSKSSSYWIMDQGIEMSLKDQF